MARGDTAKEIEQMKEDFKDLDIAIVEGAKQFKVLRDSISKTESILGSTNWVIFSRFISGTPLWRIQNRIKATVMLLNEISQSAEKRRTEEAKEIQNFAKIAKMKRKAVDIESRLLKIESLSGVEKQKAIDALKDASEQYEGLSLKLGSEKKAREKLLEIMEDRIKVTDKLEKKAMLASELADADFKTKMKHFSGLRAAQESFNEFRTKAQEQINESEMAAEKTKLTRIQKMRLKLGGLDPSRMTDKDGNVKGPSQELDTRSFATMFGKGRFRDARGKFASEKQYKLMQKMHKINKRNAAIRKRFIVKPLQKITKKVKEMALNMFKLVFYALAQFMKMVLILMVIVTAFKIIEPFLGNIWKAITTMASVLYQGIMMIVEGVALMFTGVYNVLSGILNIGNGGGEQILKGLAQIALGLLDVLGGIIVATFGTIIAGVLSFVGSLFTDGFNALGGGINGIIGGIGNVFKGVSGVVAAIAMVVATIGLLIGATFALPALIVAGVAMAIYLAIDPLVSILVWLSDNVFKPIWNAISNFSISDVINDLVAGIKEAVGGIFDEIKKPSEAIKGAYGKVKGLFGLSTGGRIKQSGVALVGEKGPELVTLPKAAQVHSNSASKAIASSVTNNITVQVTGRVGANDAEIRDIANKVAKEINSRMNRTSTSVVKF